MVLEGNEILNCKYVSSTSSVTPIITGKNNIIAGCDYAFVGLGGVTMENSVFTGCGIVFAIPYTITNCVLWDNGRDRTAPGTSIYSFTTLINTGNFWDPAGPGFEGWTPFGTDKPIHVSPTPVAETPEERLDRLFHATQTGAEDNPFHRVSEGLAHYSFRLSETSPLRGKGLGGVDVGAYPAADAGYSTGTVAQATILVHPGKYNEKEIHIRNGAWVWGAGDRSDVIFAGLDEDRAQFLSSGFFLGDGGALGNVTIRNHYQATYALYTGWSLYDTDIYNCNTGVRQMDDDFNSTNGEGKRIELSGNFVTNCAGNCVSVLANVYDLWADSNFAALCSEGLGLRIASQGGGGISRNTVKTTAGIGIFTSRHVLDIIGNWVEGNQEGIVGGRTVANNVVIYNQQDGVRIARDYMNNTIYANGGWGINMSSAAPVLHRIENNIVFSNGGGSIRGAYNSADTIRFNLVDNLNFNITGNPILEGNFAVPPQFAEGEFHLLPTSPAIDAGTTDTAVLALLPATDYDGAPRIQDGNADHRARVDIGAYEFPEPPPSGDFFLAR